METQGRCEGWIAWWAATMPCLPVQFHSVAQSWTAAGQGSLSITNSWIPLKLMSIVLMTPSNHLILCHPLLLLPLIFPSIRVFSNESVLHMRWPKYWSFSFSISPSNKYSGLISFRIDWFSLTPKPHPTTGRWLPGRSQPEKCLH